MGVRGYSDSRGLKVALRDSPVSPKQPKAARAPSLGPMFQATGLARLVSRLEPFPKECLAGCEAPRNRLDSGHVEAWITDRKTQAAASSNDSDRGERALTTVHWLHGSSGILLLLTWASRAELRRKKIDTIGMENEDDGAGFQLSVALVTTRTSRFPKARMTNKWLTRHILPHY